MAIQERVEEAIKHGQKVIYEYDDGETLHEAGTRYAIIDPILQALGWDTSDPGQVLPENWRKLNNPQRVADYALLSKNGDLVVLIEAKGYSKTKLYGWAEEKQLQDYAPGSGAELAVLTNGKDWYFYYLLKGDSFDRPRDADINICCYDVKKTAKRLIKELSRYKRSFNQP